MGEINHPYYYNRGGVEAIEVIEAWNLGFCLGNAVKYISRAGYKAEGLEPEAKGIEDLEKASWYISREIAKRKAEYETRDDLPFE